MQASTTFATEQQMMAASSDASFGLWEMFADLRSELIMFLMASVIYLLIASGKVNKDKRPSKAKGKDLAQQQPAYNKWVDKPRNVTAKKTDRAWEPKEDKVDLGKVARQVRDLGKDNKLDQALELFNSTKQKCPAMSALVYNSVMDACVQCLDSKSALSFFEEAVEAKLADVVTYNTAIKAHLSSGDLEAAQSVLNKMTKENVTPSHVTFHSLMHASTQAADRRASWKWVSQMRAAGLAPTSVTCSILLKLIDSPQQGVDVPRVLALVEESETIMDEVLLSSLVEACLKSQRLDMLAKCLHQSREQGLTIKLSAPTYGSMIKAYGQSRNVSEVWALWGEMKRCEVQPTMITLGCMVDALVMNGAVDSAWKLVQELQGEASQKALLNTVIYSTILKGFAMARNLDKVNAVYDEMMAHNIECNTITYNTMLNALVRCGDLSRIPTLLENMKASTPRVEPDMITYSTIMKGYCSSGDLDKSLELLKDMGEQFCPDEVMYNSLLEGCAKQQRLEDALMLLERMKKADIPPSNYTLSIMIKLLGRSKRLDQAFTMLKDVTSKHNVKPNIQVYTCLMQACFHNRQLKKALMVHDDMVDGGCHIDQKAYCSLARGCLQANNAEKAAEVVRCAHGIAGHGLRQSRVSTPGVDRQCLDDILGKLRMTGKAAIAQQLVADLEAKKTNAARPASRAPWAASVPAKKPAAPAPWRKEVVAPSAEDSTSGGGTTSGSDGSDGVSDAGSD